MDIKILQLGTLRTNCYVIQTQEEVLIIDPAAEEEKIIACIKNSKSKISILNTHYHFDHTLANKPLKKHFPHSKTLIHKDEKKYIDFEVDIYLEEDDVVKVGEFNFKVIHTPGHSKGSICLIEKDLAFTGDTLFNQGYGRTDLPGGDFSQMTESLKKLDSILKEGMTIYPGHGESFKMGNFNLIC